MNEFEPPIADLESGSRPSKKQDLLESAMDSLPDGIVVFDGAGTPVYWNAVAKDVLGEIPGNREGLPKDIPLKALLDDKGNAHGHMAIVSRSGSAKAEPEPE